MPFSQLDFVRRGVVSINGEIALICFCGVECATRRKERCKNKKERVKAAHQLYLISYSVVRFDLTIGCNDLPICQIMKGSDLFPNW